MSPKKISRNQPSSAKPRVSRRTSAAMAVANVPTKVLEPVSEATVRVASMVPTEVNDEDDDANDSMPQADMEGVVVKGTESVADSGSVSAVEEDDDVMEYAEVDPGSLTELLLRQLTQDAKSYEYDRSYCENLLQNENLEAQEARSLKLRLLDLRHQARLTHHKIELLTTLGRCQPGPPSTATVINGLNAVSSFTPINGSGHVLSPGNLEGSNLALLYEAASASPPVLKKRARKSEGSPNPVVKKRKKMSAIPISDLNSSPHNNVTRLGHWSCRLCTTPKYLGAPTGRLPSAPCKWPLRDVSKMMVHFGTMHNEHSATERATELGDALAANRGPFEYWLRHSRHMDLGDGSILDDMVSKLQSGKVPSILQRLSKAAAQFPPEMVVD